MQLGYTVQPFDDEIRDAYLRLLPHQGQVVAAGKLEWKFRRQPAREGLVAVARDETGRILGLNAFMPSGMRCAGQPGTGFQSMDTIVDPDARGQGVFSRLIAAFYAAGEGRLLYGFPNASSAPGFFGKLGWTSLGTVPMLIKPLRAGYFLKRMAKMLPDFPLPSLGPVARAADPVTRFDACHAAIWQRFATGVDHAVERDAAYLNWRLFDHPSARYDALMTEDAFAVGTVAEKHGGRIGYVMEALGPAPALAPLIGAIVAGFRARRADAALAWCLPHSPNYAAYRKAGFLPFPDRLRPITLHFGARALGAPLDGLADPRRWYVSYLDSDTV